jgi:hypothetical protein
MLTRVPGTLNQNNSFLFAHKVKQQDAAVDFLPVLAIIAFQMIMRGLGIVL